MEAPTRLRIAGTPGGKDALFRDALETAPVSLSGCELEFHCQPMSVLNRAALHGFHDVTAISSVLYPQIAHRYAILNVGGGVCRGQGPLLVGREPRTLAELGSRPVGVPGIPTTSWFLLRCQCPDAVPIEMPCDRIAEAVSSGELEAGVLADEELLDRPRLGLHRVADLGTEWCQSSGLPLPLSLHVIRRDLGPVVMQRVCTTIRRGLRQTREQASDGFASEDSLFLLDDVRMGLRVLFAQVVDLGLSPQMPDLDIVEGVESAPVRQAA